MQAGAKRRDRHAYIQGRAFLQTERAEASILLGHARISRGSVAQKTTHKGLCDAPIIQLEFAKSKYGQMRIVRKIWVLDESLEKAGGVAPSSRGAIV